MEEDEENLNAMYEHEITCPYCLHKELNSWEQGESGQLDCDACGKDFKFEREVSVTYSAYKIKH